MGNLNQLSEQLNKEFSLLQNQWQVTASQWKDVSQQRFESEFVDGNEEIIYAMIKEIDNLAQVFSQALMQVP